MGMETKAKPQIANPTPVRESLYVGLQMETKAKPQIANPTPPTPVRESLYVGLQIHVLKFGNALKAF